MYRRKFVIISNVMITFIDNPRNEFWELRQEFIKFAGKGQCIRIICKLQFKKENNIYNCCKIHRIFRSK